MGGCKDAKDCRNHHLCKLVKRDELEQVRKLAKKAEYFCKKCGRAARDKENLCSPSRL